MISSTDLGLLDLHNRARISYGDQPKGVPKKLCRDHHSVSAEQQEEPQKKQEEPQKKQEEPQREQDEPHKETQNEWTIVTSGKMDRGDSWDWS
ncbi:hypothetical protein JHK84_035283 [Glycine max]|nr:hypothetical protein JHK84_035283 [Glycine max]